MKKVCKAVCALLFTAVLCGGAWAQSRERPKELPSDCRAGKVTTVTEPCFDKSKRVNDMGFTLGVGTVRDASMRELSQALKAIESRAHGTQIGILSLPKFEGDEQGFALAVARYWGLGQAGYSSDGRNNGLLIFIYPTKDGEGKVTRHNMRIETGSGLEGALPDGMAGTIMRKHLPLAKDGNFAPAVQRIVGELSTVIFAEYKVTKETPRQDIKGDAKDRGESMLIAFLVIYVAAAVIGLIHWMLGTAVGGIGGGLAAVTIYGTGAVGSIALFTALGLLLGSVAWFLIQVFGIPGFGGGSGGSGDSMAGGGGDFGGGGASSDS